MANLTAQVCDLHNDGALVIFSAFGSCPLCAAESTIETLTRERDDADAAKNEAEGKVE